MLMRSLLNWHFGQGNRPGNLSFLPSREKSLR
jgi:hypothetical protein